ncbi:hypothetical protein NC651_024358 [Populus alba x Populus x berolinensis]|nr:hypothetical protein NC651_024358 [Populus alba x Populus x berolinensis]
MTERREDACICLSGMERIRSRRWNKDLDASSRESREQRTGKKRADNECPAVPSRWQVEAREKETAIFSGRYCQGLKSQRALL